MKWIEGHHQAIVSPVGEVHIFSSCRETGQRLGMCRCTACRPDLSYLYTAATNTAPLAGASS